MFKPKRVVFIGSTYPENELYCPHFLGVRTGLTKLGIPFKFVSCRPELNVDEVVNFNPDLVIYGLNDMVKHFEWRKEIKDRLPNAYIVMWYGDLRNEVTTQFDARLTEIDAMFVSNDAQEEFYKTKWRVKKVHYLPLGCEPIPKPIFNRKFSFPFVFIGGQLPQGAFHDRATFIERFKQEGGLTLVNSYESNIRARIYRAMPEIYSSSKISLDVSHFTDIKGYTSIRYWEIPAMYGFALTKRWPGCEEFYPVGTRAYFSTYEEAIELKEYYLKHEDERVAMVRKAHELSYNFDYEHRFNQMFEKL